MTRRDLEALRRRIDCPLFDVWAALSRSGLCLCHRRQSALRRQDFPKRGHFAASS
jgi:hypothetical protein